MLDMHEHSRETDMRIFGPGRIGSLAGKEYRSDNTASGDAQFFGKDALENEWVRRGEKCKISTRETANFLSLQTSVAVLNA